MTQSQDLPDVFIEMLISDGMNIGPSTLDNDLLIISKTTLDTNDYGGDAIEYWFEVTACNNSDAGAGPDDGHVKLVDEDFTEYADITVPPNSGESYLEFATYRVQFTPVDGEHTYYLQRPKMETIESGYFPVSVARIVIRYIKEKARIQIPLFNFGQDSTILNNYSGSCRIHTDSTYRADFDYRTEQGSYAIWGSYRWQYNQSELSPITEMTFAVAAGNVLDDTYGYTRLNEFVSDPYVMTSILSYQEDGSLLFHDIEGATFVHNLADGAGSWTVMINHELFMLDNITFFVWISEQGYYELTDLQHGSAYDYASAEYTFSIAPDGTNPGTYDFQVNLTLGLSDTNNKEFKFALFDYDTDTMVAGTELVWAAEDLMQLKSVDIASNLLTDGHYYEVRAYNEVVYVYPIVGIPSFANAALYLKLENIEKFTSWQRVNFGNMYYGWSYPDGWGEEYSHYSGESALPTVSTLARTFYHHAVGARVQHEMGLITLAENSDEVINDANFGSLEYSYVALWDDGENDESLMFGLRKVAGSAIYVTADEFDQGKYTRVTKRSGDIILTNRHRYGDIQPDDLYYLKCIQGFIVITVDLT